MINNNINLAILSSQVIDKIITIQGENLNAIFNGIFRLKSENAVNHLFTLLCENRVTYREATLLEKEFWFICYDESDSKIKDFGINLFEFEEWKYLNYKN